MRLRQMARLHDAAARECDRGHSNEDLEEAFRECRIGRMGTLDASF